MEPADIREISGAKIKINKHRDSSASGSAWMGEAGDALKDGKLSFCLCVCVPAAPRLLAESRTSMSLIFWKSLIGQGWTKDGLSIGVCVPEYVCYMMYAFITVF